MSNTKKKSRGASPPQPAAQAPAADKPTVIAYPTSTPVTTDREWAYANFPVPTLFLGDLFHSRTKGMHVQKTDTGKTTWGIGLGLALAYGRSFCDWVSHKPCRVLYIEGETYSYNMQRTIRAQRKALGIRDEDASPNFTLITRQETPGGNPITATAAKECRTRR
jgi:hypothetical protein